VAALGTRLFGLDDLSPWRTVAKIKEVPRKDTPFLVVQHLAKMN